MVAVLLMRPFSKLRRWLRQFQTRILTEFAETEVFEAMNGEISAFLQQIEQ